MYKAIKGYEGIYEVNELGQVRSVYRIVKHKDGSISKRQGKELKLMIDKDGYLIVGLSKRSRSKRWRIHKLVAEAFLPNHDNLTQIHHLNHDRKDNRIQNLMWVSKAGQRDEHWRAAQSKIRGTRIRVVGNGVDKIFNSSREAEKELGTAHHNLMKVAKGIYKQIKGYQVYFVD